MSYLGVGIHDNVVLSSKTAINDKGSLVIELETKVNQDAMFAAFDGGADIESSAASIIMWPVSMANWEGKTKTASEIGQDLNNFKNTLVDILAVYMTLDKAKAALGATVMFNGLGITAETQSTLPTRLLQKDFVDKVYLNVSNAFVAAAKPFMDNVTFRIKLRRTSKAKHFSTIPMNGKFKEVWIEPSTIPAASSQISWSAYEIKRGLNDGTKVEADASSDAAKVDAMFAGTLPPTDAPATPAASPVIPEAPATPVSPEGTESGAALPGNPFNQ